MRRLVVFFALILLMAPAGAITITVTNCASGTQDAGSLPWALVNLPNEPSLIQFNIPNTDPGYTSEGGVSYWRIRPDSELIIMREDIQVRGSTQTANQGNSNPNGPEIEINGANLPSSANVFLINGNNNCTIEGLTINRSKQYGVTITNGNNNNIYSCYIGCDASGEAPAPNSAGGIYVDRGASNNIGGIGRGCVISGNDNSGLELSNSVSTNIFGNYIGTKSNGIAGLGNGGNGVLLKNGAKAQYIANANVIAFNGVDGVQINGTTTEKNTITQNSFFSNGAQGIHLLNGANAGIIAPTVATAEFYSSFGMPGTLYVSGTGPADSTIEIMKVETPEVKTKGEGKKSVGFAVSDASGGWFTYLSTVEIQGGDKACATATDRNGNTSEFSLNCSAVSGTIVYRPDAMIGKMSDGSDYVGLDVFNLNGYNQTVSRNMYLGESAVYYVKIKNSGNVSPDRIVVTGTGDSSGWKIRYFGSKTGSNEITANVAGDGWVTPSIPSSETIEMMVIVESNGTTAGTKEVFLTASSQSNTSRKDVVKAVTEALTIPQIDRYSFSIAVPASAEAGKAFAMTVTAKNINGQITTEVSGLSYLSVDSGTISVTSLESSQFAANGIWQGSISLSNVGNRTISLRNDYITAVATAQIAILVPQEVATGGLYRFGPNPYNPGSGQKAVFWYWLNEDQTVSVNIFDLQGNLLFKNILQSGDQGGKSGINSMTWDGRNVFGEILENGVYIVKIVQGTKILYSGKVIILK